jgi:DNA primase
MGKISPPSIKYIVKVKFETEGVVEKPDIIGAVFGQTEGLLGEDLELRELQKKGKIGRIEVNLETNDSKTTGVIEIPTSIDKAETTIIAAAVETIDRVGPTNAKFEISSIEDVRTSKRDYILERAKVLMKKLSEQSPESREMEQQVLEHNKTAKVVEYGSELLAAGPDIDISKEIIVVEGRADVVNLLRAGIKNAIAMNGTMLPRTIKELSKEKEVTLFVDGDRGGILISKDAISTANIAFIARAPDGKEVEELTEKEINLALRARMTVNEFKKQYYNEDNQKERDYRDRDSERKTFRRKTSDENEDVELNEEQKNSLKEYAEELKGSKSAAIFAIKNNELKQVKKIMSSDIVKLLYGFQKRNSKISALIVDDLATAGLINIAEQLSCKLIIAKNFAATSNKIEMMSF